MNGEDAVVRTADGRDPVTRASLAADLSRLGLAAGDTAIVHTSLSQLGWVAGGAQAVILALMDVVGADGTLVMPTHTGQLSDPSGWRNPPVPERWWPILREQTPAYDPDLTVTRKMGVVAETFRRLPGVRRSAHPLTSFAAWGRHAARVTGRHPLGSALGWESPLAAVHELDGKVLLLGVDHGNDTSLHLAEHRAEFPGKALTPEGAPVIRDGARVWAEFEELAVDDDDFASLGEDFFRQTAHERRAPVGWGEGRLCAQRAIVAFAIDWLDRHRR